MEVGLTCGVLLRRRTAGGVHDFFELCFGVLMHHPMLEESC